MKDGPRIFSGMKRSYYYILLFGIVAMFGDVIYEGARSVTGPYLYILGASAFTVGFVAGFGEFLGYALRLLSGYIADSTRHYWALTFTGYAMLIAVPLIALAGSWEIAAALFIAERMGKGIRAPAKDSILSNISADVGRGTGFGLHEALDQAGAVVGPLVFTAVYITSGSYQSGFAVLLIPFALMLATLVMIRRKVPDPVSYEENSVVQSTVPPLRSLLPYGLFTALTMCGFAAFPIISYHFSSAGVVPDAEIPLFYAIAMGVDALAALAIGRLYDRKGLIVLVLLPLMAAAIPFLAFSYSYTLALISAVLWGCIMGIQETVLRAAIADYTHVSKRGTAYGIFNSIYGASWFLGSVVIGYLYSVFQGGLTVYILVMEILAVSVFFIAKRALEKQRGQTAPPTGA